jgi:hypothetical protein
MSTATRRRHPIEVAGLVFRTKTALRDHVRAILYAHAPEAPIGPPSASFLEALLSRHPHREQKVGVGVACFFVRINAQISTQRGFWLRRVDGTETWDRSGIQRQFRSSGERHPQLLFPLSFPT